MRFCGKVGFISETETSPGVWEPVTEERIYKGDVLRDSRRWDKGLSSNDTFTITNTISINADAYAYSHLDTIRWVEYNGVKWRVATLEIDKPRIKLTLGGVYTE